MSSKGWDLLCYCPWWLGARHVSGMGDNIYVLHLSAITADAWVLGKRFVGM